VVSNAAIFWHYIERILPQYEEVKGVSVGVSPRDKCSFLQSALGASRRAKRLDFWQALNVLQNDFGINAGCWRWR